MPSCVLFVIPSGLRISRFIFWSLCHDHYPHGVDVAKTVGGVLACWLLVPLGCYRQGMSVEEIVQQYPSVKPADVHDALAYAYDHLDEIEADLAADDEAMTKSRNSGGAS